MVPPVQFNDDCGQLYAVADKEVPTPMQTMRGMLEGWRRLLRAGG